MEQCIKIFIPLGTQRFQFNRLVEAMNRLVEKGLYNPEEIVMQAAIYETIPVFRHYTLLPLEQFNDFINKAELIITHSGVNSIISCMKIRKPLIIVPRQKQYGEHVDDHQIEIATLMKTKYDVIVAEDLDRIENDIELAKHHKYNEWVSNNEDLMKKLKKILD